MKKSSQYLLVAKFHLAGAVFVLGLILSGYLFGGMTTAINAYALAATLGLICVIAAVFAFAAGKDEGSSQEDQLPGLYITVSARHSDYRQRAHRKQLEWVYTSGPLALVAFWYIMGFQFLAILVRTVGPVDHSSSFIAFIYQHQTTVVLVGLAGAVCLGLSYYTARANRP